MNVGDEYYEVSFTTPLTDREVIRIARLLDVDLAGVRKVCVSFVRDPLDSAVLRNKIARTEELEREHSEPSLFDDCEKLNC